MLGFFVGSWFSFRFSWVFMGFSGFVRVFLGWFSGLVRVCFRGFRGFCGFRSLSFGLFVFFRFLRFFGLFETRAKTRRRGSYNRGLFAFGVGAASLSLPG